MFMQMIITTFHVTLLYNFVNNGASVKTMFHVDKLTGPTDASCTRSPRFRVF